MSLDLFLNVIINFTNGIYNKTYTYYCLRFHLYGECLKGPLTLLSMLVRLTLLSSNLTNMLSKVSSMLVRF